MILEVGINKIIRKKKWEELYFFKLGDLFVEIDK